MSNRNSDDPIIFVAGTLLGVLTGVVAGIMYSPKPGNEIRQDLKNLAKNISDEVPADAEKVKETFTENLEKVKNSFECQLNKINDAMKAGKLAAAKQKEEQEESSY